MKKVLIILCLFIATISYSQNDDGFEYIGDSNDGTQYFVKIEKINFNSKDAWLKWVEPTKPDSADLQSVPTKYIDKVSVVTKRMIKTS